MEDNKSRFIQENDTPERTEASRFISVDAPQIRIDEEGDNTIVKKRKTVLSYCIIAGVLIALIILAILILRNHNSIPDYLTLNGNNNCYEEFESYGGERTFVIEKNFDGLLSYSGGADWCLIEVDGDTARLKVSPNNTKEMRIASLSLKNINSEAELASLVVSQKPLSVGLLSINSEPAGAEIWIDGNNTKVKTPGIIEDIPLGQHKLTIKNNGYEDVAKVFNIKVGNNEVFFSLRKNPTKSEVYSDVYSQSSRGFLLLPFGDGFMALSNYDKKRISESVSGTSERIRIDGYVYPSTGSAKDNMRCGEQCVVAVARYIQDIGVSEDLIETSCHSGSIMPFDFTNVRVLVIVSTD